MAFGVASIGSLWRGRIVGVRERKRLANIVDPIPRKMGEALMPMLDEAIKRLVGEAARADELIIELADGQVDVHAIGVALTEGQAAVDAMADLCKHSAKNC